MKAKITIESDCFMDYQPGDLVIKKYLNQSEKDGLMKAAENLIELILTRQFLISGLDEDDFKITTKMESSEKFISIVEFSEIYSEEMKEESEHLYESEFNDMKRQEIPNLPKTLKQFKKLSLNKKVKALTLYYNGVQDTYPKRSYQEWKAENGRFYINRLKKYIRINNLDFDYPRLFEEI